MKQGGGQPPSGNQPQQGGQTQNGTTQTEQNSNTQMEQNGQMPGAPMGGMNLNTEAVTSAIANLDDEDTAAALTALLEAYEAAAEGDDADATQEAMRALQDAMAEAGLQEQNGEPMNRQGEPGLEYGRFLDVDKVTEAIGTLDDEDTASTLSGLLTAYEEAAAGDDDDATQEALQALLDAMADAQLQVGGPNGMPMDGAGQGGYLDTDAVANAISALTNEDTASSLTALLEAYITAAAGDDTDATQTAFTALMDALTEAGIRK